MNVFLIDADNLSMPEWIDESFQKIETLVGEVSVRRAYGCAEKLKGLEDVIQRYAIRPYHNLYLTKNTTDIALAADAMELACQARTPKTVFIGSGDTDFLPLVVRLRERGIHTVCITDRSKMSTEAISAYNQVIYVGTESQSDSFVGTNDVKVKKAESQTTPPKPVKPVVATKVAAKKVPTKKVATKKVSATPTLVTVEMILKSVPGLKDGDWHSLGEVHKPLIESKLIGKTAASTKVFKKFPEQFELEPAKQPNKVRYLGS